MDGESRRAPNFGEQTPSEFPFPWEIPLIKFNKKITSDEGSRAGEKAGLLIYAP